MVYTCPINSQICRHIERLWLHTRSPHQLKLLHIATYKYHSAIIDAKKRFNASLVSYCSDNPRKIWNTINILLDRKPASQLPSLASGKPLSQMFATFLSRQNSKTPHCIEVFFYAIITSHTTSTHSYQSQRFLSRN
jgi:hypothetical protein